MVDYICPIFRFATQTFSERRRDSPYLYSLIFLVDHFSFRRPYDLYPWKRLIEAQMFGYSTPQQLPNTIRWKTFLPCDGSDILLKMITGSFQMNTVDGHLNQLK